MKHIAVIYHSAHGNTEHFARQVVIGAQSVPDTEVTLLKAEALTSDPDQLIRFDGFIWGSPTYLGGVSGPFKSFMDSTGRLWRTQQLKGKLAAGFTVSALPSGDKQSTLLSMFTFSMQHGMIWVGNPFLPEQQSLVVSGISTFRATGLVENFLAQWISAWLTAWLVAFPLVLLVAPVTRRIVQRLVGTP